MKTKTPKVQSYRFVVPAVFLSAPLSLFLSATPARAQEGLMDVMGNEAAARAEVVQAQNSAYTFKSGDFRMLLSPALSMEWNDNINCTESGKQDDFIILPTLGITTSYPLTDRNLLLLNVTVGYDKYLLHPSLSSWYLASGSGLSFDVYIKDIRFNLHDQFSYQQSTSANANVAGTGTYGSFENTAGIMANWNLRYVNFTAGYDHENTIATTGQFNNTDNGTETGYAQVGYNLNSRLTTGVEATVSYTGYNQAVLNNNTEYTVGVYGDWHPDTFLHIEPRVGYLYEQFGQSSQYVQTSDVGSWYADLSVSHKITRSITYSIDGGRNVNLGVQSDATEYWYANTGITWNLIRNFSLQPQLFFQHGTQGVGSTLTALGMADSSLVSTENYNWYGGSIGFNYDITRRFTVSWNYGFTQRTSNVANRGYTQNVIGILLTYHTI